MVNKFIRTTPRYLAFKGTVNGDTYTVSGDNITVTDDVALDLADIGTSVGVATVITDGGLGGEVTPPDGTRPSDLDTGWVDLELIGLNSGESFIRRVGSRVLFSIDPSIAGGVIPSLNGKTLPDGFWPGDGDPSITGRTRCDVLDDGFQDAGYIVVGPTGTLETSYAGFFTTTTVEWTSLQPFPVDYGDGRPPIA